MSNRPPDLAREIIEDSIRQWTSDLAPGVPRIRALGVLLGFLAARISIEDCPNTTAQILYALADEVVTSNCVPRTDR